MRADISHPYVYSIFGEKCDLICTKGSLLSKHLWPDLWKKQLLKHQKTVLYTYSCYYSMCIQNCFWYVLTVVPFHKSGYEYFDRSGPFLWIRSQMFYPHIRFSIYVYIFCIIVIHRTLLHVNIIHIVNPSILKWLQKIQLIFDPFMTNPCWYLSEVVCWGCE